MKMHVGLGLLLVGLLFFSSTAWAGICQPSDPKCGSLLANGCDVNQSISLNPGGMFNLPQGIDICADDITINCNGATLIGTANSNIGISATNYDNLTLLNCKIKNYFVGVLPYKSESLHVENGTFTTNTQAIRIMNSNDSEIIGNTFVDNGVSVTTFSDDASISNGLDIIDNTFTGGTYGAYLQQKDDIVITGNEINNMIQNGVIVGYVNNLTVSQNNLAGNDTNSGINAKGSIRINGGDSILVSDNSVSGGHTGIYFYFSTNTSATNNHVDSAKNGFKTEGGSFNVFTGNELLQNDYGFYSKNDNNSTLINNTISENNLTGFYSENSGSESLQGNTFEDNKDGITISNIFGQEHNLNLTGNIIQGNERGLLLTARKKIVAMNNQILQNEMGVEIAHASVSPNTFASNFFQENETGLWINNSYPYVVSNNTFEDNTSIGLLSDAENAQIIGNQFSGNAKGIKGDASTIAENTFTGNIDAVWLYAFPTAIITHNNFMGSTNYNVYLQTHEPFTPTESEVELLDNYWNATNASGNQDCAAIDNKIFDYEEGGGSATFHRILHSPYPGGQPEDKCTPILLVHGIYSSDDMWHINGGLIDTLETRGFRYATIGSLNQLPGLFPNNGSIPILSGQVYLATKKLEDQTGEKKVDVVAHSMGGLVTRTYTVGAFYRNDIRKFVMLGTPNEGAPIAAIDIPWFFKLLGLASGPDPNDTARMQMIPDSNFLSWLNAKMPIPEIEYYAVAGTKLTDNIIAQMIICGFDEGYCPQSTGFFESDTIVPAYSVNFLPGSCVENPVTHTPALGTSYYDDLLNNINVTQHLLGEPSTFGNCTNPLPIFNGNQTQIDQNFLTVTQNQKILAFAPFNPIGTFSVGSSWEQGQARISIRTPSGQDINSENYINFPGVEYQSSTFDTNTGELFTISNPNSGSWQISIEGASTAPTMVNLLRFTKTSALMQSSISKTSNTLNENVQFNATLTDGSSSILGSTVHAEIRNPQGSITVINLFDDGLHSDGIANDGIYGGNYNATGLFGGYSAKLVAQGTSSNGTFKLLRNIPFFVDPQIDIAFDSSDITIQPVSNSPVNISVGISNQGTDNATGVNILLFNGNPLEDGVLIGSKKVNIPAGQTTTVNLKWTGENGFHTLYVASPFNDFIDANQDNQLGSADVFVSCSTVAPKFGFPGFDQECLGTVNNRQSFP